MYYLVIVITPIWSLWLPNQEIEQKDNLYSVGVIVTIWFKVNWVEQSTVKIVTVIVLVK